MKERVVEILVFLMSEMMHKRVGDINLGVLEDRGYSQSEISAAFDWLDQHVQVDSGWLMVPGSRASRRQLHAVEQAVISTEGHGYLMQLCELGLLDTADLEAVIERAMASGIEKLTAGEMHQLVASVLFAKHAAHKRNSLPVDRQGFMMNNNDTIH